MQWPPRASWAGVHEPQSWHLASLPRDCGGIVLPVDSRLNNNNNNITTYVPGTILSGCNELMRVKSITWHMINTPKTWEL